MDVHSRFSIACYWWRMLSARSHTRSLTFLSLLALALAGCTVRAGPVIGHGYPPLRIHVPDGHMPPPGSCHIWFPDRPPGQQPPPGPCHVLKHRVPPGAYLVRG